MQPKHKIDRINGSQVCQSCEGFERRLMRAEAMEDWNMIMHDYNAHQDIHKMGEDQDED